MLISDKGGISKSRGSEIINPPAGIETADRAWNFNSRSVPWRMALPPADRATWTVATVNLKLGGRSPGAANCAEEAHVPTHRALVLAFFFVCASRLTASRHMPTNATSDNVRRFVSTLQYWADEKSQVSCARMMLALLESAFGRPWVAT